MNNFATISSLKQLHEEKRHLQKRVRKQENAVLKDISVMQASARKWVDGALRLKNVLKIFLPRVEFATLMFPLLRRIFRKRKK